MMKLKIRKILTMILSAAMVVSAMMFPGLMPSTVMADTSASTEIVSTPAVQLTAGKSYLIVDESSSYAMGGVSSYMTAGCREAIPVEISGNAATFTEYCYDGVNYYSAADCLTHCIWEYESDGFFYNPYCGKYLAVQGGLSVITSPSATYESWQLQEMSTGGTTLVNQRGSYTYWLWFRNSSYGFYFSGDSAKSIKVYEIVDNTPACSHQLTAYPDVEPTCLLPGNEAYWACSLCGKFFADANAETEIKSGSWTIAALGHDYQFTGYDPAATCTEDGVKVSTCTRCSAQKKETAACTGHSWDGGVITREAGCLTKGTIRFTCETCGAVEDRDISACGHSVDDNNLCTRCGKEVDVVEIGDKSAKAHTMPFQQYYKYASTAFVYSPVQVGEAGTIETIAFNVYSTKGQHTMTDVNIYMGVQDGYFSSGEYPSGLELVYSGDLTIGKSTGWETIVLDTPYEYDGEGYLVIAATHAGDDVTDGVYYYQEVGSSGSVIGRVSDDNAKYADITNTSLAYNIYNTYSGLPDIRIVMEQEEEEPVSNALRDGDVVSEGGTYYMDKDSTGIVTIATSEEVTLVGPGVSWDDEYNMTCDTVSNFHIDCSVEGVHLTIQDVFISTKNNTANVIDFTGSDNVLDIEGTVVIDYDYGFTTENDACIHVGLGTALTITGGGTYYQYNCTQGAGIGGNTREMNGTIIFDRTGSMFIKGTKQGAVIGAGAGASSTTDAPGEVSFVSGEYNIETNSRGAAIGGSAGSTGGSTGTTVYIYKNANVNVNCDYSGAAVGGGGYAQGNDSSGGTLVYYGGSLRTYMDRNAASNVTTGWNGKALYEGPNDAVITAQRKNADDENLYWLPVDTALFSSYEADRIYTVELDGEEVYKGYLPRYGYQYEMVDREAAGGGRDTTIDVYPNSTVGNWYLQSLASQPETNVYLFATGEEHEVTIDNVTYIYVWNENDETFSGIRLGDPNFNGKVNINDAQTAYNIAKGLYDEDDSIAEMKTAADFNRDGDVDASDARAIQVYVHEAQ